MSTPGVLWADQHDPARQERAGEADLLVITVASDEVEPRDLAAG